MIALITEWKDADGTIKTRDANSDLGGTMRLGAQSSDVAHGTLAHKIYGDVVTERHRHRYEANVNYLDTLRKAGLVISALTQREHLTEIVELPQRRAPLVHRRAVPPRVQVDAVGRPPAVQRLHQGRAGTPGSSRQQPESRATPESGGLDMKLCGFDIGLDQPFFLIAGPCVVESEQLQMDTAGTLKEITASLGIPFIFKCSFDKANRSSRAPAFAAPAWKRAWKSWPRSSASWACRS